MGAVMVPAGPYLFLHIEGVEGFQKRSVDSKI